MKCNMDCFHCQYLDCVNDDLSYDEMKAQNEADKEIKYESADGHKKKIRKSRGYDKRYYENHKIAILSKAKNNLKNSREANRKYYYSHVEQETQRSKEKYINNRDKRLKQMSTYNKAYYARKKERQAG